MEYLQYRSSRVYHNYRLISVLNLVINGIPSILPSEKARDFNLFSFKPCYKWNTFNTNLLPLRKLEICLCFKPCYKWNTFNTIETVDDSSAFHVLNLVINGIPSIHKVLDTLYNFDFRF